MVGGAAMLRLLRHPLLVPAVPAAHTRVRVLHYHRAVGLLAADIRPAALDHSGPDRAAVVAMAAEVHCTTRHTPCITPCWAWTMHLGAAGKCLSDRHGVRPAAGGRCGRALPDGGCRGGAGLLVRPVPRLPRQVFHTERVQINCRCPPLVGAGSRRVARSGWRSLCGSSAL